MSSLSVGPILAFAAAFEKLKSTAAQLSTKEIAQAVEHLGGVEFLTGDAPRAATKRTTAKVKRPKRRTQLEYARDVLRKFPKGLHYTDIAREVLLLGCKYKGKTYSNPIPEEVVEGFAHSLNSPIAKCDDFISLGGGRFKLKVGVDQ
jgi:hypothetical protein